MYSIIFIIFLVLSFYSFNLFLISNNIIFLFVAFIFIILLSFVFTKLYKKKKSLYFSLLFIVLFFLYIFVYSYIPIDNNKKDFSKSFYSSDKYNNYVVCLEKECINDDNFKKDIEYIKYAIWKSSSVSNIIKLNSNLNKFEKKLSSTWYKLDNKIDFDYPTFVDNFLNILYLQKVSNIDFRNNLFFNKEQYLSYLNKFYLFSYNNIISNNGNKIKENTYFAIPNNPFYYLVNRRYVYNRFFINNDVMNSNYLIMESIKNTINNINKNNYKKMK